MTIEKIDEELKGKDVLISLRKMKKAEYDKFFERIGKFCVSSFYDPSKDKTVYRFISGSQVVVYQ